LKWSTDVGVFEFIILLVLISTLGKVLSDRADSRALSQGGSRADAEEIERLRSAVDDLSARLSFLEEERDFYRDLLEAPDDDRALPSSHEVPPEPRD
jgi:hypothetical protein